MSAASICREAAEAPLAWGAVRQHSLGMLRLLRIPGQQQSLSPIHRVPFGHSRVTSHSTRAWALRLLPGPLVHETAALSRADA